MHRLVGALRLLKICATDFSRNALEMHNLGIVAVKYIFPALALVILVGADPAVAGSLTDPIVAPEVVSADAIASSPEKLDGLVVAVAYVVWIMLLGGAF